MNSKIYLNRSFIRYVNDIQIDTNKTFITPSNLNLEIKFTREKGYGVFATSNFQSGDIIEKCYCIKICDLEKDIPADLKNYAFQYPPCREESAKYYVLPLGYGCVYNHSDDNNAKWVLSKYPMFFDYLAIKNINKDNYIKI